MIVDKQFIAYFKLAHGFFNASMMALFFYQAWLGLVIRKARLDSAPLPLQAVRRHRRGGPAFALWGVMGYLAGVVLVLLDKGRLVEYPLHFVAGSTLACCIGVVYAISRRIQGPAAMYRRMHFRLGAALVALYVIQTVVGLSILL